MTNAWLFGLVGLVFGLIFGMALAALFLMRRVAQLERRNAELEMGSAAERAALERAGAELDLRFKATARDILAENSEQFLARAQEKLKEAGRDGAHDLEKRQLAINALVEPLQKQLATLGSTVEQIKGTDFAMREDLKALSRETAKLAGALRDPTAQGRWGEYILDGLMENSGLIKGVHYETQVANSASGQRPDAIINLSDKLKIVVDAKTPLNDFVLQLDQTMSETESLDAMKSLAGIVDGHVSRLAKKSYWENIDADSVDFTVLFLPSEQLFSMALRGNPRLADIAVAKNIVIASPTLMMALLRVVKMGWRQANLAENAREISEQGSVLYQRLQKFFEHFEKIGKGLSGGIDAYNAAVGSLDRMVLPAARKLQDMGVQDGGKNVVELKLIETAPRSLTGTDGAA